MQEQKHQAAAARTDGQVAGCRLLVVAEQSLSQAMPLTKGAAPGNPTRQDLREEWKGMAIVADQESEIQGSLKPQIEANLRQTMSFCRTLTFPVSELEIIPPCTQQSLEA